MTDQDEGKNRDSVDEQTDSQKETETDPESGDSAEDVDFDEHPVGASPNEVMDTIEEVDNGALPEVLSKYEPEQFTSLVDGIIDGYHTASRRKYRYNLALVGVSILLVLILFGGLLWFTLNTDTSGSALIFFAGTLAGYFMRLATELT